MWPCIRYLVREEGYRYKEIAVVAGKQGHICGRWACLFAAEHPYCGRCAGCGTMPLAGGLVHALEAVRSNFDNAAVLCWAKSPLMGLDPRAAQLETTATFGVWGRRCGQGTANNPGEWRALTEEVAGGKEISKPGSR